MLSRIKAPSLSGTLAFLFLIGMPAAVHPTSLFQAARSFPVGLFPNAVAVGDLTGDDLPDLVSANEASFDVTVLKGLGDGSFGAEWALPVDESPYDVALGRFDDNESIDIATAGPGGVTVLLNGGPGGFKNPCTYAVGDASAIAAGDLTGDGNVDLVTANTIDNAASVLVGNGDGTFREAKNVATGPTPSAIAVGDLDGDGASEFVTANWDDVTISVIRCLKSGEFSRIDYAVGPKPAGVAIGDVNGDGKPDVAVTCWLSQSVKVLLNDGTGNLMPATSYTTGESPVSVAITDINGDGIPDLVTTNEYTTRTLSVLLGTGKGTFRDKVDTTTGAIAHGIAIADFDQDGNVDLASTDFNDNSVLLFRGGGKGGFIVTKDAAVGAEPRCVALGYLDGDSQADLVTANEAGNSITVWLDGARRTDYPVGAYPMAVAVGDLTGDGHADVVAANHDGGTVSVLLGNGDGTLRPCTNWATGGSPWAVAIADLNHDGKRDLVTGVGTSNGGDGVSVLLGHGDGTFQTAVLYRTASPSYGVVIGDVNGDGNADIATANFGAGVSVFLGHGDGTFHLLTVRPVPGAPRGIAMSDLNGDGIPDLITADQSGNTVSVLLGDGTGAFSKVVPYDVAYDPSFVAAGDLTGDGIPDLAVANTGTSLISILPGAGDGTFRPRMDFVASLNPSSVAIGDLDGVGLPDIVTSTNGNSVSVLYNMDGPGGLQVTATQGTESRGGRPPRVSPNPLNPSGVLSFYTGKPGAVDVRVFDVQGRLVRTIAIPFVAAGAHEVGIDGRDASGSPLGSGVYFYSLRTPDGMDSSCGTLCAGTIWAGGPFSVGNGGFQHYMAAFDAGTAALKPWNPQANGTVESIFLDNGVVYAGGTFTSIGGASRMGAAALDGGTALASAWNPEPSNADILAFGAYADDIYMGGSYTTMLGASEWNFGGVSDGSVTAAPESPTPPAPLVVHATPNPFGASTSLQFTLAQTEPTDIAVYSVTGRLVRHLRSGVLPAGRHSLKWDGRDDEGRPVGSGVYVFRVRTPSQRLTGKLLRLK